MAGGRIWQMADKGMDDLLESAENELGEDKPESKEEAPSLQDVIKEVTGPEQALGDDLPPEFNEAMDDLAEQLESSPEMLSALESLSDQLFSKEVLLEEMTSLRDSLEKYLLEKREELSAELTARYEQQLAAYKEMCIALEDGEPKDRMMTRMAEIAQLGDLPAELAPPMPQFPGGQDCRLM